MARSENLINIEHVSHAFGTRTIIDDITIGLGSGDVIGVVGRNGDGKTTLLRILTGDLTPDSGRVTHTGRVSIGYLTQLDDFAPEATVRDVIVNGEPDHVWAADATTRGIVTDLLADLDLDAPIAKMSGGERRRTALVALMLSGHDLLVLDEPTNHLDVEAVTWLADHLNALQARGTAMLVVSHDRWFLDAICTRIWEVHDGTIDTYDGGYAAYVLARVERQRMAAVTEAKRQNLARKELAWLRRGAPARTSKPKFRIDAANELIADVPDPRDKLELQKFATARLGKDVFDINHVDVTLGERVLFDDLTWSIGPGDRIGLIGVNGAGKTTLLRLLTGDLAPSQGKVKCGKTLRVAHLSQAIAELDPAERVLDSVESLKRETKLATGRDATASSLLGDFGFTGDRLTARIGELSGGERRRLQFLRLLMSEPNVLLLDEPTNDLDIDTLTVVEDYLDTWPGTLIVVSHDRYFLERVTDWTYALMGDGRCVLLPGGVDQYLDHRRNSRTTSTVTSGSPAAATVADGPSAAELRQAKKDLARLESQLAKLATKIADIHNRMATAATDYAKLATLEEQLRNTQAEQALRESEWIELAELTEL
ncbi:MAG: ABC-F family ATP-binding cassette domain-containing protein [Propionibacteriaceae bacterium]